MLFHACLRCFPACAANKVISSYMRYPGFIWYGESKAVFAFFAPIVGFFFSLWSQYWDGVKKVDMGIKKMTSVMPSQEQADIESGQGAPESRPMNEFQGEIRMIKDRVWVAEGECSESLGQVVRDRLGSGGYGDHRIIFRAGVGRKATRVAILGSSFLLTTLIGVHRTKSWKRLRRCNCWSRRSSSLWYWESTCVSSLSRWRSTTRESSKQAYILLEEITSKR
jgi:hypothetical protein